MICSARLKKYRHFYYFDINDFQSTNLIALFIISSKKFYATNNRRLYMYMTTCTCSVYMNGIRLGRFDGCRLKAVGLPKHSSPADRSHPLESRGERFLWSCASINRIPPKQRRSESCTQCERASINNSRRQTCTSRPWPWSTTFTHRKTAIKVDAKLAAQLQSRSPRSELHDCTD